MKRILVFFALVLLAAGWSGFSKDDQEQDRYLNFSLSDFFLKTLPGGCFYANFIEFLAPDTTSLIEESNGFSLLDTPRVYFEGDPYLHFQWNLQGIPADSLLDQGGPAFQPPFSAIAGFGLNTETPLESRYGFNFGIVSPDRSLSRVMLSTVYTDLGSFSSMGKWLLAPHAVTRSPILYSTRRKLLENRLADFTWQKAWKKSSFLLAGSYYDLNRQFNDFNTQDTVFQENGKALSLLSRYTRDIWKGGFSITTAFYRMDRDRFPAETGRYPQETYNRDRSTFYTSAAYSRKGFVADLYFQTERENRTPRVMDFGKDLFDIDGEGLFPYERWGRFNAQRLGWQLSQSLSLSPGRGKTEIRLFFNGERRRLSGNEDHFNASPITAKGQPYLVINWSGIQQWENRGGRFEAGFTFKTPLGHTASLTGKLQMQHQALSFAEAENNLDFWHPDFDLGLVLNENRNPELVIAYGELGYDLGVDLQFFLDRNRPAGTIRHWDDTNGDDLFQTGEAGAIFGFTGSPFHGVSTGIRLPRRDRFLLGLSTRISRNFRLDVKGLFKRIRHPFWVEFAEDYGYFEKEGDLELFFFNRPFRDYLLTNAPFAKDPFYAQLSFDLKGFREKKWYFSFSFLAHMGMGTTAFGNGPGANDVGVIDESQADPNSWIHGFGRLDGDRAFVGRVFFGFYPLPRLFFSGSIRYRDGDPFAFLDAYYRNSQWVLIYHDIKAEDEHMKKGGPREDALWDFNLKLSYFFKVFGRQTSLELSGFNLLDFGSELSENVFSGGWRWANELQLARTVRLGISVGL